MQSSWKTLVAFVAMVVIFAGGYYYLRAGESSLATLEAYMQDQVEAPATVCVVPDAGSFTGAIQNFKVYIDKQNLRADWVQLESREPQHIHVISNDNGATYYVWSDEVQNPLIIAKDQMQKVSGVGSFKDLDGDCRPLWFPDQSLFVVPESMTFKLYVDNG